MAETTSPSPTPSHIPKRPWGHRVGWLVVIWAGSVTALAVVAGLLRVLMNMAGMTADT